MRGRCGTVWCVRVVPRGSLWLAPHTPADPARSPLRRSHPVTAFCLRTPPAQIPPFPSHMIITLHPSGTQHHGRIHIPINPHRSPYITIEFSKGVKETDWPFHLPQPAKATPSVHSILVGRRGTSSTGARAS